HLWSLLYSCCVTIPCVLWLLLFVPLVCYSASLFFFFSCSGHHRDLHLSLHDALPISGRGPRARWRCGPGPPCRAPSPRAGSASRDRKSTRLNSSHGSISYAVFCLKKKKK